MKVSDIQPGCILAKDITGKTNRPIIPKKTVLTGKHIEWIKAFLINEVSVERMLISGQPFTPSRIIHEEGEIAGGTSFSEDYLNAVSSYKKLFMGWQAGAHLDVTKVRELFIPLLHTFLELKHEIFYLHHYSVKEDYLYHHAIASGLICGYIGRELGYNSGDIIQAALAGCLSDCGMSKITASIIHKQNSLTASEFEEVRKHPALGYKMVKDSSFLKDGAKLAIAQHHERLDGSGYPVQNMGQKLHPFSKIAAVADVYHAMTSERIYRKKESPFKVLEMIRQDCFGKYDLTVLQTLMRGIERHLTGNKVKLSNGFSAEVLFVERNVPTRPLIKYDHTGEIVNLEQNRDLFIQEVLQ
ncbi:HD-GYP domain-containing protein [Peribacillus sp. SCS-26]|uniref:HD-GYP domain-containing protein n=1 Tax=Paraperibacillus marinus TaxID=3115295 RepID=UPI00390633B2